MKPSILITGCSSGIGLATARLLRDRGWHVFPTARKAADLERLRSEGFDALALDVADSASIQACVREVLARCEGRLDALVNNAGFGQPGALEDVSRDALRRQFETNVFGLLELTNALLPGMIARGAGRVVHVSSVVGRIALPFMGAYSATKFAVEALADVQRVELADTGVWVSLVEPGPIATEFSRNAVGTGSDGMRMEGSRFAGLYRHELAQRAKERKPKPFTLPPEAVARAILHAVESRHPRRRYKVTLPALAGAWISRLLPHAWLDALLIRELRARNKAAGISRLR